MSTLHLVRHGPTNAKTMVGWTDLPADLGDTQALSRLTHALPDAPVISSDLIRATATADAIQHGRTRLPHDPRLREMHFGAWENRTWAALDAEDPAHIRAFWETPGDVAPPDGESWNAFCARVSPVIDDLAATHPAIIIVCHFGVILSQLQRALQDTTTEVFGHKIDNLSVTTLQTGPWGADQINRSY